MNEEEWLSSRDGEQMLNTFAHDAVSERKARLYAAACCRLVWPRLGKAGRKLTEIAEDYADVADGASEGPVPVLGQILSWVTTLPKKLRLSSLLRETEREFGPPLTLWLLRDMDYGPPFFAYMAAGEAKDVGISFDQQSDLVREIFGNPFRPYPVSSSWPATVVQLAEANYRGTEAAFALHDALLEAGHPELAEHFQKKTGHPKGCWVVDLLLGKK